MTTKNTEQYRTVDIVTNETLSASAWNYLRQNPRKFKDLPHPKFMWTAADDDVGPNVSKSLQRRIQNLARKNIIIEVKSTDQGEQKVWKTNKDAFDRLQEKLESIRESNRVPLDCCDYPSLNNEGDQIICGWCGETHDRQEVKKRVEQHK